MLKFQKLRYRNLLSTGNTFTEIDLSEHKSTLIIGSNGAGKTTIMDALTFALYGKAYRNINKNQLVNSINKKHLVVELEFSTGKHDYLVRRGIKPIVFEIFQDGNLINQNAESREYQQAFESNILKLNYKSFLQIVVIGTTNYVPFMQLSAQTRREIIEDLLDIQIFSKMNTLLKEKVQNNREDIYVIERDIELQSHKIELHEKHLESLKQNNQDIINAKIKNQKENNKLINKLKKQHTLALANEHKIRAQVNDQADALLQQLTSYYRDITHHRDTAKGEIEFYHNSDICPVCKQNINDSFKETIISQKITLVSEYDDGLKKLETKLKSTISKQEANDILKQDLDTVVRLINTLETEISTYTNYHDTLTNEINQLIEQTAKMVDVHQDNTLYEQQEKLNTRYERLLKQRQTYELASTLLKDNGIKTQIIRQFIPIINKLINKYLAAMDFFVNFELDDNFNEKIKSRFRDEFSYDSFSEGEKFRLDLSMLFAWRTIAKMRNSTNTNLLILDEVFDSSLDAMGTDEFLKILDNLADDTNTFTISHKTHQLYEQFDHIIKFVKHGNFSTVEESE